MQLRTPSGCVLVLASIIACGGRQPDPRQTAAPPPPTEPMASAPAAGAEGDMCPMMMMDPAMTQVTATDTSDGVALVFATTGDVEEVRARARRMAEMHEQKAGMHGGEMHGHGMEQGGMGMMHVHMVPSRAMVEEVPEGARIVFVPTDPDQLATLRQHVHMHADMVMRGQCPMVAQPTGAEPPPTGT